MKILICYHTITGNTELVAKNMAEELASQDITICPASDVDISSLINYDVVFLGSGTYAASVGKTVKKLIKSSDVLPSKFVLFYTHSSPGPNKCFYRVEKELARKNASVIAKFECLGATKPTKEQLEIMTSEQLESYEKIKGRPDDKDLKNAREFAKKVIQNLT